ncbi:MAG: helix-turn-helix transcriptional regulator [Nitrospinae bacterium]|nr:helix-turn-helix transcriptional regulator [Nitrospinota bacterium]
MLGRESIGGQIRAIRKVLGYTEEGLGKLCGVERAQISRLETGKELGSGKLLHAVAEALGCALCVLPLKEILQQENAEINQFIEQYRVAIGGENTMAHFWAEREFRQCAADIHRLIASDEFEYPLQDHDIVMGKLYGLTGRGDWIQAVSWDEKSEWEDGFRGDRYIDFNVEAVKRGVNVERIFLYRNPSELKNLRNILRWQQSKGIKARIADTRKLGVIHRQNRLIINAEKDGKFIVYPEHNEGIFIKAFVSWDKTRTEEFERIYQTIRASSTEWRA